MSLGTSPASVLSSMLGSREAPKAVGFPDPETLFDKRFFCEPCEQAFATGSQLRDHIVSPAHLQRARPVPKSANDVRPPPRNVYGDFRMCRFIASGRVCDFGADACTFAHSQEELNIWRQQRDAALAAEAVAGGSTSTTGPLSPSSTSGSVSTNTTLGPAANAVATGAVNGTSSSTSALGNKAASPAGEVRRETDESSLASPTLPDTSNTEAWLVMAKAAEQESAGLQAILGALQPGAPMEDFAQPQSDTSLLRLVELSGQPLVLQLDQLQTLRWHFALQSVGLADKQPSMRPRVRAIALADPTGLNYVLTRICVGQQTQSLLERPARVFQRDVDLQEVRVDSEPEGGE